MRRIVFAVLFFGLVIGAMFWFYTSFDKSDPKRADALRAVPAGAALIFETDDAADIWRDLSQTNMIWEELRATDLYFRLDQAAHAIDSAMRNEDALRSYMANKPIAISVHSAGARSFSYLLSLQLSDDGTESEIKEAIAALFRPREAVTTKTYDGVELITLKPTYFDETIYYFIHEGLLVLSFSTLIAEESIRTLLQETSVLSTKAFAAVRKTRGSDARGQLYVNYQQLKSILVQYAAKAHRNHTFFQQNYAGWSALDVSLKANAIVMNGFVQSPDSTNAWLGAFQGLAAPKMDVLRYMPSNTAYFAFFGYGVFADFRKKQLRITEQIKGKFALEETRKGYDKRCTCDSEALGLSWIGNQSATFVTEPASEEYAQNQFAIFTATDPSKALSDLTDFGAGVQNAENLKSESETYRDIEIKRLPIGRFYSDMLGESFGGIENPYMVRYDNMIILGNSLNGIRTLINALIAERTLANDKAFAGLENQISGTSNFLIYSSLARSPFIYQHILDEKHATGIAGQSELLRSFQAFVYQVSYYKNDLYYNNVYFRHNPDYKQETNSLWEIPLGASVSRRPYLLTNHYTKALEIFMQDDSNHVYLLSNTGKVLWDMPVDGPIIGDVQQVDVYRNSKFQILFSTTKSIYLIDRNGNGVESYPVRLPAPASSEVSAVDYDKNRDYRFFIGVQGGGILAYDIKGKPVDGWQFKGFPSDITGKVEHIRVRSRDYLFALSKAGDVLLLDRQGKPRHEVRNRAVGLMPGGFQVNPGVNSIEEGGLYYMDSLGIAYRLGFDDRLVKYTMATDKPRAYDFKDLNGDGERELIVLTDNHLETYELSGKRIFKNDIDDEGLTNLQYFRFPDGKVCIGLSSETTSQIMLYNADGSTYKGFPLYGSLPFAIGDMNRDGYFNLITANREGFVYAYAIE